LFGEIVRTKAEGSAAVTAKENTVVKLKGAG